MKEYLYINYRKIKAFLNSICFYSCRIFPIDPKKITISSYEGKGGYGCNPKYIVEQLHKQNQNLQFIWLVNDMDKKFPEYITKVPNTIWKRAYHLSTSGIWIDNYRKPYGTKKRKKQIYINTWHGDVGFKAIGLWRGSAFSKMAYLVSKSDSAMIDRVVVDTEYSAIMMRKGLLYDGEYLRVGQPRCDILHGNRDSYKEAFKSKYDINHDVKLVLYAPTFREGSKEGKRTIFSEEYSIDFERLLNNLSDKFGEQWVVCLKLHPQLSSMAGEVTQKLPDHVINVSGENDMYEVLAAMDALITDYSSVAFEASYFHLPVFIYADDIEKYANDRGGLLWMLSKNTDDIVVNNPEVTPDIHMTLPFPIAKNNDELERRITAFEQDEYDEAVDDMTQKMGLIFNGNAGKKVAEEIIRLSDLRTKNG